MTRTLIWILAVVVTTAIAFANGAPAVWPGDASYEPDPMLSGIAIEHEDLEIDLRALSRSEPATITARYRLRNSGRSRRIPIRFVVGGYPADIATTNFDSLRSFYVKLDAATVSDVVQDSMIVPTSWLPPRSTPAIEGDEDLSYSLHFPSLAEYHGGMTPEVTEPQNTCVLRFVIEVDSGDHELLVRYRTRATETNDEAPTLIWQLGYVLAPARRWDGFGSLSARVILPSGWLAAANPLMRRSGDTLIGEWKGLPGDAIGITARFPTSFLLDWMPTLLSIVVAAAILGAGIFASRSLQQTLMRHPRSVRALNVMVSLALALAVAAAARIGWDIGTEHTRSIVGEQAYREGYGCAWIVFILPIVFLAAFIIIHQLSVSAAARVRATFADTSAQSRTFESESRKRKPVRRRRTRK